MKRVASILLAFLTMVAPVGASDAPTKEWTVAVFFNGDNDLDKSAVEDQEELAKVGSSDWLNVVTLIDRQNGPTSLNFIEKGHIRLLEDKGEIDMGDFHALVEFARQAFTQFPARHNLLVVWSHGMGWSDKKGPRDHRLLKGISPDDQSGNRITTAELGVAMTEIHGLLGRKLDILAMDSCLMQMAEVAKVVKDHCDFVVASEESEPNDGYPFDDLLSAWQREMPPAEVARTIVGAYMTSYSSGSQGQKAVTQSAIDCARLDAVYASLDEFARVLMAGPWSAQIRAAREKAQQIDDQNVSLPNLVEMVKAEIGDDAVSVAADRLSQALAEAIIANGATSGSAFHRARGLAVYFPSEAFLFNMEYNRLPFCQDHLWNDFLIDHYKKITTPQIIAAVEAGDIAPLLEFAAKAGPDLAEVRDDLVTRLNFRVFTEGGLPESTEEIVRHTVAHMTDG